MTRPIILLMEKYKTLTKDEIIGELADWFNVIGDDEFNQAVKDNLIVKGIRPELYTLNKNTEQ